MERGFIFDRLPPSSQGAAMAALLAALVRQRRMSYEKTDIRG